MHIDDALAAGFARDPQSTFRPCDGACGGYTHHDIVSRQRVLVFACSQCGTVTKDSAPHVTPMETTTRG